MKFNWIAEWKCNEIELFSWIATIVFVVMFIVGLVWDGIAGSGVANNKGIGLWQLAWCAFWGLLAVYGMLIATKWGE